MTSEEHLEKFHTKYMSLCYPDLGSASVWLKQISVVAQLIRSARSGQWSVINVEFLCSFVRCYLVGGGPVKCRLFSLAVFVSPVLFVQKCPLWVDSYANELNCKQLTLATICLNQRQRLMFKNYHHLRTKSIFLVCWTQFFLISAAICAYSKDRRKVQQN